MEKATDKTPGTSDRELFISRLLDAPRDLVWEVWTNPEHIKNWWGPDGFTNTIYKMEVRPGGVWEFIMHGPDGTDYKNKNIFREIVKPEKIVFEHVSVPPKLATVLFKEQGNQTRIEWQMLFQSADQLEDAVRAKKIDKGLKQNIEKLNSYLTGVKSQ